MMGDHRCSCNRLLDKGRIACHTVAAHLQKGRLWARAKSLSTRDPGQDDAVAILLAFGSPDEIEVLGITAVAGNVPLAMTVKNARIICELAGRNRHCDLCRL